VSRVHIGAVEDRLAWSKRQRAPHASHRVDLALWSQLPPLRLEEDHRVSELIDCWIMANASAASRARDHAQAGGVSEDHLRGLAVMLDRADAPPKGMRITIGS